MWTEMETAATIIGAEVTLCEEVPMVRRERWEEIRRLWVAERVPIAKIRAALGPGSQDRPTPRSRHDLAAVSPRGATGDAADGARRVSARTGGAGRLLGTDPVSGAPAARVSRQLRDGEALRPAPAGAAFGRRAGADPVRDAARTAEPEVNGTRVLSSATSFKTAGCRVAAPRECLGVQATGRSATPARRLWRTPSL
jgi:hypothetical protein